MKSEKELAQELAEKYNIRSMAEDIRRMAGKGEGEAEEHKKEMKEWFDRVQNNLDERLKNKSKKVYLKNLTNTWARNIGIKEESREYGRGTRERVKEIM